MKKRRSQTKYDSLKIPAYLVFFLVMAFAPAHALAQNSGTAQAEVPRVFLIGEHSDQYARISSEHPANLLSVYQNDMELAYEKWAGMLVDMEQYADEIEYDIKGLKLWLHVYFNPDGSIQYLSFYPKPNSRNVPVEEIIAFFKSFCKVYRIQVNTKLGFQQSASASFPTFFGGIHKDSAKKE